MHKNVEKLTAELDEMKEKSEELRIAKQVIKIFEILVEATYSIDFISFKS